MPNKAKKPCSHFGCPNLTTERYCEAHKKDSQSYDRYRGSAKERGYDSRWRRYRDAFLKAHPVCECDECKANGWVKPATVVDHIIPHKGDTVLFWDPKNHQAMYKPHHDAKTAREDGGFNNPRK